MRHLDTIMGIPMSVDIRDDGDWSAAVAEAFGTMRAADRRFSRFRDDSEISAFNRGEVTLADVSDELREVLRIGAAAQDASGGAFTVRTPDGGFDTDGVVKGWAAARAAEVLRGAGVRNFCLNAGGDVVVSGLSHGTRWNVGIRSPSDASQMLAVLAVTDCAVATSGSYERGSHIVDGRTALPATTFDSVTVIADDLTTADVVATAVFALGAEGIGWALEHNARGVLAHRSDGELVGAGDLPFATS